MRREGGGGESSTVQGEPVVLERAGGGRGGAGQAVFTDGRRVPGGGWVGMGRGVSKTHDDSGWRTCRHTHVDGGVVGCVAVCGTRPPVAIHHGQPHVPDPCWAMMDQSAAVAGLGWPLALLSQERILGSGLIAVPRDPRDMAQVSRKNTFGTSEIVFIGKYVYKTARCAQPSTDYGVELRQRTAWSRYRLQGTSFPLVPLDQAMTAPPGLPFGSATRGSTASIHVPAGAADTPPSDAMAGGLGSCGANGVLSRCRSCLRRRPRRLWSRNCRRAVVMKPSSYVIVSS